MPFRYYNVHPRKLSVDDCTKRSITLTTGIPYREVQKGLNEHKKVTGVKLYYNNPNPRSYVETVLGFPRVKVEQIPPGKKILVRDFAESHPRGRYILSIGSHWTACIDGVIYDTWDCRDGVLLSYYEITRFERTKVEKKYCFTVARCPEGGAIVTVYDGNGSFAARRLSKNGAEKYVQELYDRGFFNFDEMGEYI